MAIFNSYVKLPEGIHRLGQQRIWWQSMISPEIAIAPQNPKVHPWFPVPTCQGHVQFLELSSQTNIQQPYLIELDDGKILTGKPDQFDGKNHGFL